MSIQCEAWSSERGCHFKFWNRREGLNSPLSVPWHSSQDILVVIFCTSLGQCKVNVGNASVEQQDHKTSFVFKNFDSRISQSHNDSLCYWSAVLKYRKNSSHLKYFGFLDIFTNPALNSEGFGQNKKENPNSRGGGLKVFLNFKSMGDNSFWKFQRQGGLEHRSHLWFGMDIFWNHLIEGIPA